MRRRSPSTTSTPLDGRQCVIGVSALRHMNVTQLPTAGGRYIDMPGVKSFLGMNPEFLGTLGGEDGCRRLSAEFYPRVGQDPVLRPFFPSKSLRFSLEAFTPFLLQF